MIQALAGRRIKNADPVLATVVERLAEQRGQDPVLIELGLRLDSSPKTALQFVRDVKRNTAQRARLIQSLGETRSKAATDDLLELLKQSKSSTIQRAILSALGYFADKQIPSRVLALYGSFGSSVQSRAIDLLSGRSPSTLQLLTAIGKKSIPAKHVTLDQLRRMQLHDDKKIETLITKMWGKIAPATSLEKRGRITAILQMLGRRRGNRQRGLQLFTKSCANCHKLHGKGTTIGPDLTGAERKDRAKLLHNIVDPSAVIRPQFATHVAVTLDGRVLTGLLADSKPKTITLLDAKNKRTILSRSDLKLLKESPGSLMPDKLLEKYTDQQIRDLVAYLQSK